MLKLAVLVSGGGTNLQAIMDGIASGSITNAKIVTVISNNRNAYALTRAEQAGIPASCISPKDYADREAFHEALLKALVESEADLIVLAESEEAGIFLILSKDNSQIFCMGHPEYDRLTLDKEYKRDLEKGMDIQMPVNYYPNDDVNERPFLQWRSHANCLYTNYLDYYVYQMTPYDLHWLPKDKR